jgi:hypothetical protein
MHSSISRTVSTVASGEGELTMKKLMIAVLAVALAKRGP